VGSLGFCAGRESNGFLKRSFSFAYMSYQAMPGEGFALSFFR